MKKAVLRISLALTLLFLMPIHLSSTKNCADLLTQEIGIVVDNSVDTLGEGDRIPLVTDEVM